MVEEENNRNVVLVDGKQWKFGGGGGGGGVSGVKIKKNGKELNTWREGRWGEGAGASKIFRLAIGRTIEMWCWCRENKKVRGVK